MTLPLNWSEAPLNVITRARMGPTILAKDLTDTGIPVFSAGQGNEPWGFTQLSVPVYRFGTVILSARGTIGNPRIPSFDSFACTQTTIALEASAALNFRYLKYYLKSIQWKDLTSGAAIPMLTIGMLSSIDVPLAPESEQTRIADKLDTVLARVDACRDRLARVAPLLKRFRQSVLAAATSGRLSEEWRGTPSTTENKISNALWAIPSEWNWCRADEIAGFITKGTTPSKESMSSGAGDVPYLKVYNLGFDGEVDFTIDPTFVSHSTHREDLKRSLVLPGDVLMNIVGPPLGKVAVVPDTFSEWNINQAIARFRPSQAVVSQYLCFCLMNTALISFAVRQAKATAGQFNLTLEICRALPIALPALEEQVEIVRRVESLFSFADRLEARLTQARSGAERLTPALLAKAFRGELVPQDPEDEPAAELLKRLASERTASGNTGTQRRKVRKETA